MWVCRASALAAWLSGLAAGGTFGSSVEALAASTQPGFLPEVADVCLSVTSVPGQARAGAVAPGRGLCESFAVLLFQALCPLGQHRPNVRLGLKGPVCSVSPFFFLVQQSHCPQELV